jgi:hypothetical protein
LVPIAAQLGSEQRVYMQENACPEPQWDWR